MRRRRAAVRREKEQRAEGLRTLEPLPQQIALFDDANVLRICQGGNRSGKTAAAVFEAACHAMNRYPTFWREECRFERGAKVWYVVPDFGIAEEGVREHLDRHIPPHLRMGSDKHFMVRGGGSFSFRSARSGRSAHQAASVDFVVIDEEVPQEVYEELRMRVLNTGGRILMVHTPVLGPAYIRHLIRDGHANLHRFATENNLVSKGGGVPDTAYATLARELGEAAGTRLYGLPPSGSPLAYPAVERCIGILPMERPEKATLVSSWDFNVIGGIGLLGRWDPEQGTLLIYEEFEAGHQPVTTSDLAAKMAAAIREWIPRPRPVEVIVYGDASGDHRDTRSRETDYSGIQAELHKQDIRVIKRLQKNPLVQSRVEMVNRWMMADPPGVRIDKSCRALIADLEEVRWRDDGTLDKREILRTHASDALGYLVWGHSDKFKREERWQIPAAHREIRPPLPANRV